MHGHRVQGPTIGREYATRITTRNVQGRVRQAHENTAAANGRAEEAFSSVRESVSARETRKINERFLYE